MKALVILAMSVLSLSVFSVLVGNVSAGPGALWKNVPPSMTEKLKAQLQGNSTDGFVSQYPDPRGPSYSQRASMFFLPSQILVEVLAAVSLASLVFFAMYLYRSEKSPEQALRESERKPLSY